MEKTKEEFTQFIRHGMQDRNSNEFIELYQFLLGCFVRADANLDGQVTLDEFDQMIEEAAVLPRRYGYAPKTEDLYPDAEARKAARAKQFADMDANHDGHITFEEWLEFSTNHIVGKSTALPRDILAGKDHTKEEYVAFIKKSTDRSSPEYRELFHFLLKCFVDGDKDRDGAIQHEEFDQMIEVAAATPRRHGLAPATKDLYKTEAERKAAREKTFNIMDSNGDGNISFDEWLAYALKHIVEKVATV